MKIYKAEQYIADGHTVGIFQRTQENAEGLHAHEFIEVVYILAGHATEQVDDAVLAVERGDMIFIPRGGHHAFSSKGHFSYVNICFRPEVLSDAVLTPENAPALLLLSAFDELRREKSGGVISFGGEERREVEFILTAMLREYGEALPHAARVMESYLNILFTKMLRQTERAWEPALSENIWQGLREYIEQNPDGELSLSALAEKSFYNPSYFSRVFKQRFGTSLSEYVRKTRIERAMRLLSITEESVDAIMKQVGYTDRSAFYHAFSKEVGATPTEYRARHRVK